MAVLNENFEFVQDDKTYSLYDLPDGFVIKGDVDLSEKGLTELPDLSKVTIEGNFYCGDNNLTTLRGAPREVGGYFWCENNQLTSLEGAPQKVGGYFSCHNNALTTLKGAPQKVGGNFWCEHNQLTSLVGAPQEIGGYFQCYGNDDLLSLFGLPKMSEDNKIYCDDKLKERYGCPQLKGGGIRYGDLISSAKYKSELSAHIIRQKKHEENKTVQAKFKAGYAAFKKKRTEERE